VPLGNVATLGLDSGPAQIDRYDRQRNVNFEIELNGQPLGEVQAARGSCPACSQPAARRAPDRGGRRRGDGRAVASFGLAMLTGVLCIYIVLVLLFKGWVQPVTILAALVLSIPGAFWRCSHAHGQLSMPSMIG
jgi:multidrug efflux pump subunit AcrB